MHIFSNFRKKINDFFQATAKETGLPVLTQLYAKIVVEPPKDPSHGDIATNAVLILAKSLNQSPRVLADSLIDYLQNEPEVQQATFAPPGFINLQLTTSFWHSELRRILKNLRDWPNLGKGEKVNLEYVSANPTGPLHAGHGRGAAFGDVLATLLIKTGYDVTKEYFINDGGGQIETLARSLYMRYIEALDNISTDLPEGFYPGEYLIDLGKNIAQEMGKKWCHKTQQEWLPVFKDIAVTEMMKDIKNDLQQMGIQHDVFTSEESLVKAGQVEKMVADLTQKELVYKGVLTPPKGKAIDDWEPREQLLFRSTLFGDDCDRPLQKSDGSWTYFAKDIAYHYNKFQRGFKKMINVFGADHGGYLTRLQAAVKAVSGGQADVTIKVNQLVNFVDKGQPLKMSKRSGTFVTLQDVLQAVGKDVIRFMMLSRRNEVVLDFDFSAVIEQTKENPIFYIQYAHARICSVNRMAVKEMNFLESDLTNEALSDSVFDSLTDPTELEMIKKIADWPRQLEIAVNALEPHRLAFFLYDIASVFHLLWNKGKDQPVLRFINPQDSESTKARLALINAVKSVLIKGLEIFGIEAIKEMR